MIDYFSDDILTKKIILLGKIYPSAVCEDLLSEVSDFFKRVNDRIDKDMIENIHVLISIINQGPVYFMVNGKATYEVTASMVTDVPENVKVTAIDSGLFKV